MVHVAILSLSKKIKNNFTISLIHQPQPRIKFWMNINPFGGSFTKAKDKNGQNTIDITESYLRNDPNIVYIETTKEQDKLVIQNILQKIDTMNDVPYRLWTNNCNISFASACSGAGIKLPPTQARPDRYFQELQKMYPKNAQQ